ncbi:uncharacterized protein [Elaeis guineensis]|uniref:Uncharacterized protein LOC105040956 n=1 Tax=Elaeis guineensis var. tenera TaxID=51953 RepID=A0A6I9QXD4_ELAGV|nr:uncharacterized protein LOC105040956 [Elaeis guineensis]XP_010916025.1 uncharacterized protein LOC105040956 [Elaeis guineensis]
MLHSDHLLSRFYPLPPSRHHLQPPHSPPLFCLRPAPAGRTAVRAAGPRRWLAELPETAAPPPQGAEDGGGPVELPPSSTSTLFSVDDNPSPLQTSTSVLLTGAIAVFLYRSLRRRAKRAKELRVRSTGMKKTKDLKEEALDRLKAVGATPVEAGAPPSPVQALLGSIAAGVIAVILYKFTTTIEAALNRQAVSDNFSVRQITITIRTIVNGLCYLATCVFGINSIGLLLYSIQLTISSLMEPISGNSLSAKKEGGQLNTMASADSSTANVESGSNDMQQNSSENKD